MTEKEVPNGSEKLCENEQEVVSNELAPSELESKIIRQVEYYFGDINLSKDKFLQEQIKEDDGWVTIATMLKFNRLAALSSDAEVIIGALNKSTSGLMEVSEDKVKIRRSPNKPLPEMNEDRRKDLISRSVYVKLFPNDIKMDKLLTYFQQFGKIDNILMRNYHDKATEKWIFKGSVYVTFPTKEQSEEFLKIDSLKYEDVELIKMSQNDYIDMKRKERLKEKKNRLEKYEKEKTSKDEGSVKEIEQESQESKKESIPSGCLLRVNGLNISVSRDDIKKKIEERGFSVAFVDLNKGMDQGWVRLDEKDSAKQLLKELEQDECKIKFESGDLTLEAVSEEEETSYLEKIKEAKRRNQMQQRGKRRGGKGGRGKTWSFRKRKGSPTKDGPTPVKVKAE